ncbi:unnamed protein product, partial [Vitis vinifera]
MIIYKYLHCHVTKSLMVFQEIVHCCSLKISIQTSLIQPQKDVGRLHLLLESRFGLECLSGLESLEIWYCCIILLNFKLLEHKIIFVYIASYKKGTMKILGWGVGSLRSSLIMAQPQQGISKLRDMLSSLIPSASTSNSSMRSKIKEITERLQEISAQKNDLDLREIAGGWWSDRKRKREQTTSLVVESDVYGREKNKADIVDMLLKHDPSSDDEVSVIPIVGMGGIGKTTLAQLAFNDDEVKGRFDLRAWVCVSDDFDVSKITKTILQSVDPGTHDVNDLNLLQVKLKEKFSGKKFLLVLDDVWNENCHEWDTLCMPMRAGAPGSKLIVTTRNEGVAAVTRTCPAYPLRELSNNDCLSLFTQQALRTRNFDAHPHLKEVGEEIVRRCKGLPLAAKALGGMLRNQLSFLQKTKEAARPEDLGSKYFNDLFSRSFFQHSSRNSSRYVMHDLINDLAQSVAGEIYFHLDGAWENNKQSTISEKTRHSSFNRQHSETQRKFEPFHKVKCLRTLVALPMDQPVFSSGYISSKVLDDLLKEVKYLRVLSLSGYKIYGLPDSIGNLKYLRYLNLSGSSIRRLPDSVCHLYNLQALILSDCKDLTTLPVGIGNLINLRHLHIFDTWKLQEMPSQTGNLTKLQTLSKFIVGEGNNLGLRELKNLFDLRGQLSILGLHNVMNIRDGRDANLESKHGIEELTMEWSDDFGASRNEMHERNVLEQLRPHRNLKKLTIASYGGSGFPNWMKDPSFPIMTHLILKDCKRCTSLPALGQISSLKVLHIKGMSEVRTINEEFYGGIVKPFPSLESLTFEVMAEWEYWFCPDAVNEGELFPCLRLLTIRDCRKLQQLPNCLPSQVKLDISCCPNLGFASSRFASLGESFSTRELPSTLKKLEICGCPDLESMSENIGLSTPTLTSLRIEGCENLKSLPHQMRDLKSLRDLTILITAMESLAYLSLQNLISLQYLEVATCPNLGSLGSMPATLEKLEIWCCPILEERYSKEKGEYWPKIAHIPCIAMPETHSTPSPYRWVLQQIDVGRGRKKKIDSKLHGSPVQLLHWIYELELNSVFCAQKEKKIHFFLPFFHAGLPAYSQIHNLSLFKGWVFKWGNTKKSCLHTFICLQNITSLTVPFISNCPKLWSFCQKQGCLQDPQCLKFLNKVYACPSLRCFPNGELPATLKKLYIEDCENLESLPEGMMHHNSTCLEILWINGCSSLKSFPTRELPSTIKRLQIWYCSNLKSMSENMCPNNSALEYLRLWGHPNLRTLPDCLHNLKQLCINDREGLECFPARGLSTSTLTTSNFFVDFL